MPHKFHLYLIYIWWAYLHVINFLLKTKIRAKNFIVKIYWTFMSFYICNGLDVKWTGPLVCQCLFSSMGWKRVSTLFRKLPLPNLLTCMTSSWYLYKLCICSYSLIINWLLTLNLVTCLATFLDWDRACIHFHGGYFSTWFYNRLATDVLQMFACSF